MRFPAGPTILLIVLFAALGLAGRYLAQSAHTTPDEVVWTFDPYHAATYTQASGRQAALVDIHREQTGKQVQVQLMPARALDARLLSLILSDARGPDTPDLVEIEIGSVGKYFRAPPEHSGLLPLESFIAADPAAWNLLPSRVASWTRSGHVFGIPRDVHPVTITYRKDLFDEAGVDLSQCLTWAEFQQACLLYQAYWRERGTERWAIQLSQWSASELMIMVQQQHVRLIDGNGLPDIALAELARTIAFYAQLVAGPSKISYAASSSVSTQDLADAHTAALFTPDWRVEYLRWDPDLLGRLRMMALPRFSPTDARTASWGGTMVSIPKNCRDPQAAWRLLHDLQLTPAALYARQYHSSILPAVTSAWTSEVWDRADPLYGGQAIGRLYVTLAEELPEQAVSPYTMVISQAISAVLAEAQAHLEKHGNGDLEEFCAGRLAEAQERLVRLTDFAEGNP